MENKLLDKLDERFQDRLEKKFKLINKWRVKKDNHKVMYDRERKRIDKKLEKETVGTALLGLTKEEVRSDALRRVEKENPTIYYLDKTGEKHWIRYREAEFVCDAYIMIRTEVNISRQDALEYIQLFFIRKGIGKKITSITKASLNTILKRARITDYIIKHIKKFKELQDPKNPTR